MAMKKWWWSLAILAIGLGVLLPVFGAGTQQEQIGPMFRADYTFKGTSLNGWKPLGSANWKAQDGVIVGSASDANGGWLVLDKSFENVSLYSDVDCAGNCKAGVLMRGQKTSDGGMKGVLVSLAQSDLNAYSVTIDSKGQITQKDKLPAPSASEFPARGAPNPNLPPNQQQLGGGGGGARGGAAGGGAARGRGGLGAVPPPEGVEIPESLKANQTAYRPDDWNEFEVRAHDTDINIRMNGGALGNANPMGGTAPEDMDYGVLALYVGGSGEAQFKNLEYKDLNVLTMPKEEVSKNFRMQHLTGLYYSWSAQIADVNHDGVPDVIAGPYYWLGPNYTEAHEIYDPHTYNPGVDYPQVSMVSLAGDFTGDGWPDILVMSGNAGNGTGTLYVNPKGESRHWAHYVVLPHVGNEETLLKDIDGDGKPEIIQAMDNQLAYSKPDVEDPTGPWKTTIISEKGPWGVNIGHGLGVGDINGDGRADFVNAYGWWEHPPKGTQGLWKYHPQAFGRLGHSQGGAGGAEIGIYDVNGDGLNDVVTALEGHGFGLAWYEQKRDSSGNITFVEHTIMDNFLSKNAGDVIFTEPHSITYADMDGDGIPDIITGKRSFSHLMGFSDPDALGPSVLYWYRTVRDPKAPGGARFVPEMIHNMSGVGSHFAVGDLNGDGRPDVVTSTAYGTFIFFNEIKKAEAAAKSGH